MDIHRCRFVNYQPPAINALAFTYDSGAASRNQPIRLAIGRANGDIEIWDPRKGTWVHETTLRGGKGRSIEALAWIQDADEKDESGFITNGKLRLFSIGYSSVVTEWGLISGVPLRQSSGSHSEVWCLAAQPRERLSGKSGEQKGSSQELVAGCADGSLILLSTADDTLSFQKYISRASKKKARALSLIFQDRNTVVAGYANSAISVYDIRNGNLLRTMSLGPGPQPGPKDKLVWTLDCLKDGTLVSGDSSGEICFWDSKTYGQLQRIKGHEADTLCLVGSEDGKTVISGGIDRRIVVYKLTDGNGQRKRWAKTAHSRSHTHDIKAMARFENSKMSLVVSGGLDANPVLTPIREYGKEYHRKLPYVPQNPHLRSAGKFVVSWGNNEVTIWRILRRKRTDDEFGDIDKEPNYKTLAQLALKGDENITSASIASSGKLLAVATSAETKIFHLRPDGEGKLQVTKLETPPALAKLGSRIVEFSPDGKWLLRISLSNARSIMRVAHGTDTSSMPQFLSSEIVLHRLHHDRAKQNSLNGAWGSYSRTITRAAFSSDSRILAISDLDGRIDTFVLEGNEDLTASAVDVAPRRRSTRSPASSDSESHSDSDDESLSKSRTIVMYGQHWTPNPFAKLMPRLPSEPLILSFRPVSTKDDLSQSPGRLPDGNPAIHATRNNPHAHADTLPPSGADRLFVLTAAHEIYEFDVLKGQLTDWSRRNTANLMPDLFKRQRDRAMGCVWDVSHAQPINQKVEQSPKHKERIWLYGASWVCMFDLSQDLPEPLASNSSGPEASKPQGSAHLTNGIKPVQLLTNGVHDEDEIDPSHTSNHVQQTTAPKKKQQSKKKRKRDSPAVADHLTDNPNPKAKTTGAGSKIPDHELGGGVASRKVKKVRADGGIEYVAIDVAPKPAAEDSDEDSDDDDSSEKPRDALARLRRGHGDSTVQGNGKPLTNGIHDAGPNGYKDGDEEKTTVAVDTGAGTVAVGGGKRSPPFYLTYRYRPILGIVPIAPFSAEEEAEWDGRDSLDDVGMGLDELGFDRHDGADDRDHNPIEVALVERPFWDLDLPPRFFGRHEWNNAK